jgi:porin
MIHRYGVADTRFMIASSLPPRWPRYAAILLIVTIAQTASAQVSELPASAFNAPTSATGTQITATGGGPGYAAGGGIGGPTSVPAQLKSEQATGPNYRFPGFDQLLQPWLRIKNRLAEEHRFVVGGDYNVLYQDISESLTGNEEAAGGIFRVYGDWTFFGEQDKTSGSLIFKGENRSRLGTEIPPSDIGFDAGYLGIPGTLFNDNDWFLSNLYWEQALFGRVGVVIGRLEPDSFIDVAGYANPYISFQNLSILINNTIPLPDVGLGAVLGVTFQDQWSIKGGVYDASGTQASYQPFSKGGEFFTHLELSWAPSRAERYLREIHIAGWHVDRRQHAGVPESYGVAVAGNWAFDERWMPFFRAGWSDGEAPLMNRAVTGGIMRYCADRGDLTGIGVSWEDPSDRALREQKSIELFYKLQLAQNLAVTPSLQVLIDPALNPNTNTLTVFGIRGRITF